MRVYVTGDLGFTADSEEVFGGIDTKLLLATVLLVLVLLGAIYRSPLIALIPLVVVGFAYTCAQGFDLPLREDGRDGLRELDPDPGRAHVRGGNRLLPVARLALPRGAAPASRTSTRRWRSRSGRAGPAILASGLTVTLAMLVLLLADAGSTRPSGRSRRSGCFTCMIAGLTLLPALLTIVGPPGLLAAPRAGRLRRPSDPT